MTKFKAMAVCWRWLVTALLVAAVQAGAAQPTLEALLAAPERLAVDGRPLALEVYLWRDFMPISPPDGKPLMASIKLHTIDGEALPDGLQIAQVWIVHGDQVWAPATHEVRVGWESPATWEIVVRDGPKWAPGSQAVVVVDLEDGQGQLHRLKTPIQTIQRTA